jgi:hypothetical protein
MMREVRDSGCVCGQGSTPEPRTLLAPSTGRHAIRVRSTEPLHVEKP